MMPLELFEVHTPPHASSPYPNVFPQPQLVVDNFGNVAGGWRVERHPRFVTDVAGDGRAGIVGFGDAGVYVRISAIHSSKVHRAPVLMSQGPYVALLVLRSSKAV